VLENEILPNAHFMIFCFQCLHQYEIPHGNLKVITCTYLL